MSEFKRAIGRDKLKTMWLNKLPLYNYIWALIKLKKVPVDKIRCQLMPFSEELGFSGKPITCFPPCIYFQLYLTDPQRAQDEFCDWLYECLIEKEGWKVDKSEGGMNNGTLMTKIYELHKEAGINFADINETSNEIIQEAIRQRVGYYFSVLDSVKRHGFKKYMLPPIRATYRDGLYYLNGGHHRVSSLFSLGYKNIYLLQK